MMSTNIEKNSVVSEEGHVLTAYGFFLVISLASMQIKSFEIPFSKLNSGLKLRIYIDPSAWPAWSVVRIKKKRLKGKIVLKKRDQTEKKETVQRNRKQRRRESNPVYLHVQATPWPLHHSDMHDLRNKFCHIKTIFHCHRRCLKLVELYLSWIPIYSIWGKLA